MSQATANLPPCTSDAGSWPINPASAFAEDGCRYSAAGMEQNSIRSKSINVSYIIRITTSDALDLTAVEIDNILSIRLSLQA